MSFKLPVSVLVVIYAEDTKRVLMLQRRDDPAFWQSVTGSLEEGETALQAAAREVKEEVAIDVAREQLALIDCQRTVEFEIFSHLRHRYAPGVERNTSRYFLTYVIAMRRASSAIRNSGSVLRCPMSARLFSLNIWITAGLARRMPPR